MKQLFSWTNDKISKKNAKVCKTFDDRFLDILDELNIYEADWIEWVSFTQVFD